MVLWPVNDSFLAVGNCFVHGSSKGEPLLGPHLENICVAGLSQDGRIAVGFVAGPRCAVSFVNPGLKAVGIDLKEVK